MTSPLPTMHMGGRPDREIRQRILRVPREMLRAALRLPENVSIVSVSDTLYFDSDDLALKLECPDFLPRPASHIWSIDLRLKVINHPEVVFDGWYE